ncbi:5-deoxy-glucuronate isomerase [Candidatus Aerophobetes bacterium]|nr:5-deoxy-glucuronate isomerase [Candidatus Aerophobetes bacterium]
MNLKISTEGKDGYIPLITREKGLTKFIDFSLLRLREKEESGRISLEEREAAVVILSGSCDVYTDSMKWENLGDRLNVFGGAATTLYFPPMSFFQIRARSSVEIAIAFAPAKEKTSHPTLIRPQDVSINKRGKSNWKREIHDIIMSNVRAEKLLVGETFNPPGNWSSYPPHKHDQDNPPYEYKLEEIYFFKIHPPQGFGIQRIYSPQNNLDELYLVKNNDLIVIPCGYHPVVAAPGYSLYYLWVLAGEKREMKLRNDPEHEWINTLAI